MSGRLAGEAGGPIQKRIRAIGALFLVGCFASGFASGPKWLEVPYVRQSESGCGAASIAMVMQYWVRQQPGLDPAAADAEYVYKILPRSKDGTPGQALKEYLEQHGFSAFVFSGEMEDLRHHVEKGRPVVVCLAPKGSHKPLHYAVVAGIADDGVRLNDPVRGKLIHLRFEEFQREWSVTGNWSLLAVPRQEP